MALSEFEKSLGMTEDTPAPVLPVADEKKSSLPVRLVKGAGKAIMKSGEFWGNLGAGALKGGLDTIASVPRNISKGFTEIADVKNTEEANALRQQINEQNKTILAKLRTLPEGDPRRETYQKMFQQNMEQYDSLEDVDTAAENVTFNRGMRKVDEALTPEGGVQRFGYGAEKIGELMIPAGKVTQASKALQGKKIFEGTGKLTRGINAMSRVGLNAAAEGAGAAAGSIAQSGYQGRFDTEEGTQGAFDEATKAGLFAAGTSALLRGTGEILKGSKLPQKLAGKTYKTSQNEVLKALKFGDETVDNVDEIVTKADDITQQPKQEAIKLPKRISEIVKKDVLKEDFTNIPNINEKSIKSVKILGSSVEGKVNPNDVDVFVTVKDDAFKWKKRGGLPQPITFERGKFSYIVMPESDADDLLNAMLYTGRKDAERGYSGTAVNLPKKIWKPVKSENVLPMKAAEKTVEKTIAPIVEQKPTETLADWAVRHNDVLKGSAEDQARAVMKIISKAEDKVISTAEAAKVKIPIDPSLQEFAGEVANRYAKYGRGEFSKKIRDIIANVDEAGNLSVKDTLELRRIFDKLRPKSSYQAGADIIGDNLHYWSEDLRKAVNAVDNIGGINQDYALALKARDALAKKAMQENNRQLVGALEMYTAVPQATEGGFSIAGLGAVLGKRTLNNPRLQMAVGRGIQKLPTATAKGVAARAVLPALADRITPDEF